MRVEMLVRHLHLAAPQPDGSGDRGSSQGVGIKKGIRLVGLDLSGL